MTKDDELLVGYANHMAHMARYVLTSEEMGVFESEWAKEDWAPLRDAVQEECVKRIRLLI